MISDKEIRVLESNRMKEENACMEIALLTCAAG